MCGQDNLLKNKIIYVLPFMTLHLNISAAGDFCKVLLLLQSFVHLVIRHAEAAQSGLNRVQRLGKNNKLSHVWDTDDFSVQLSSKVN